MKADTLQNLSFHAEIQPHQDKLFTEEACLFIKQLHQQFEPIRQQLLVARKDRFKALSQGAEFDFLPETQLLRESSWTVAPIPSCLKRRRVEITSPPVPSMIIKALNSGADVYMADFEDSFCPLWNSYIQGQYALYQAVRKTLVVDSADGLHALNPNTAILMMRPRGWHLDETHITINNHVLSAALVDFGLYFFHNARELILQGVGPYFYLPKMEHYLEARLWADIFKFSENYFNLPLGTIKCTVLIETLPAAFQMHEILYELKENVLGLNAGRWDYIFSCIKNSVFNHNLCFSDRDKLTMQTPFMLAYAKLLIQTCEYRHAVPMGGMSAFVPVKNNPAENQLVFDKIVQDKQAEAALGFEGAWVAHPFLVSLVKEQFDESQANDRARRRALLSSERITNKDLLQFQEQGSITLKGLSMNINVAIHYMGMWLAGKGCVVIHKVMEDMATAEIARVQLWQWLHVGAFLEDGRKITFELVHDIIMQELVKVEQLGLPGHWHLAAKILEQLCIQETIEPFLPLILQKEQQNFI